MKTAEVESKKIAKAAKPRRVAGVPVRSGVKAGRMTDFQREMLGGGRPGGGPGIGKPGDPGGIR